MVKDKRAAMRGVLRMLNEGDLAQEQLVRDALRRLGATVVDSVEANKEGGWLSGALPAGRHESVLKIKSRQRATFDEGGLKQLAVFARLRAIPMS